MQTGFSFNENEMIFFGHLSITSMYVFKKELFWK